MPEKMTDWIQTYTGLQMYPLEPEPSMICVEDVAHALALKTRFNGHCSEFYSVAQHSVMMSWCFARDNYLAMWALLHDAGEAYLADVPKPVKPFSHIALGRNRMVTFSHAEDALRNIIFHAIAPELSDTYEPKEIKITDLSILINEAESFMGLTAVNRSTWGALKNVERLDIPPIEPWTWQQCEERFINRFNTITEGFKNA